MIGVLLGALLLAAPPDSTDAPCPGGAVLHRADLEAAGALHLHDVLRLTGALDGVTVDGFDAEPVGVWGAPFATAVRVLVDGAPAARGAGPEPPGLESLPVALGEVERVVVCPGGGLAAGAAGGPWIDVQTGPPAPRVYGAASVGNETGDPGPRRYLDPSLPNVDRWGPDLEAAAVLRRGDDAAWTALRHRDFLPTDPAIVGRTLAASSRYPKRIGPVGAVAMEVNGLRTRAAVRRFGDLPFVPAAGREVGLDHASAQATVSGQRRAGGTAVGGHLHAAHLTLARPAWGTLDVDPAWAETRLDAAVSLAAGPVAAGFRAEHTGAEGPGLSDGRVTLGHLWARADRGGASATAALAVAGSGVGPAVALGYRRSAGPAAVSLDGSAQRQLPEADRDLDFWAGRGYTALTDARAESRPLDVLRVRLGAEAAAGAVRLTASAEAHGARGDLRLAGGDPAPRADDGTAFVGRVGATWATPGVRVQASARAQGAATGTPAFREAWRRVPAARGALDVAVRPDGRLALWARLGARGPARWDGQRLPPALLLDFGLSKRAWADRLRLSLGGRNVLDATERTHPLGAALAPRLFVRLEAHL